MRKQETFDAPRVLDRCRHHDEGLACGICGRACVGPKVKIKVRRRGEVREVTVAQYRKAIYARNGDGSMSIDVDHYEYCPVIKETMKCIQTVPSVTSECENTSSLVCPSDAPAV